ncbi:hypothetical protein A3218_00770 [Pseudomonas chlororaphis]|uniref:phage holin family protein n=1 Tax=Pseudomonas chlororaphis TaxID=587753 RepID=UPI000789F49A|nr:phage holin family protein [Pseudomonas chlororaphis]AMS12927.1 hypothetical protein A3218_00770 [Pseudomonas chlororaphis]
MGNGDLLEVFLHLWGYMFITLVGGVVGHMMRKLNVREKMTLGETLQQGVGAAFAGYLMLRALHFFALPAEVAGVVTSLGGWLGANVSLFLCKRYL